MKIQKKVHVFLFHPWSQKHSKKTKFWATVTLVALSVITAFTYTIAFVVIRGKEANKKKTFKPMTPKKDTSVAIRNLQQQLLLQNKTPATKGVRNEKVPNAKKLEHEVPSLLQDEKRNVDLAKVSRVKNTHQLQLAQFEKWALEGRWEMFDHQHSHYDWWMFPIDRPSLVQGTKYTLNNSEIAYLKADPEFIKNFRRGVELVAKSWGWDVTTGKEIENRLLSQNWDDWPVRLGKMADSLRLFGEETYRSNMAAFYREKLQSQRLETWIIKALGVDGIK